MAELRALLTGAGFGGVETYLQSGNVALSAAGTPEAVARRCEALIAARFGLDIRSLVRTHAELDAVVRADPLPGATGDPRHYQVTFLESPPDPEILPVLSTAAAAGERFALVDREIYAWHPQGIAGSRLATLLAGRALKLTATTRNWTTVTKLLAMTAG
jgi:uncharacterized protein (DUF1697 family)